VESIFERHIREAVERGEFETPALAGKPIDDLDVERQPGWWAEKYVERELARGEAVEPIEEMLAIWRSRRRR
jgi:hypothetical protein